MSVLSSSGGAEQGAANSLTYLQNQKRKDVFLSVREKAIDTLKSKRARRTIAFDK